MSIDLDDIESRIAEGLANDHGYPLDGQVRSDAFSALEALVAEVERLRAECRTLQEWCEIAAAAENANADDARQERAAVVAWLRGESSRYTGEGLEPMQAMFSCGAGMTLVNAADTIERGEHRREEKP